MELTRYEMEVTLESYCSTISATDILGSHIPTSVRAHNVFDPRNISLLFLFLLFCACVRMMFMCECRYMCDYIPIELKG